MSRKIPQEQVNVRVDSELVEILEAAAYIERASVSELVRGAIEVLARTYASEQRVQTALKARSAQAKDLDLDLRDPKRVR